MLLSNRMHYLKDGDQEKNMIWAPYAFENFDKADIMKRLDCLVPENMYILFYSKLF